MIKEISNRSRLLIKGILGSGMGRMFSLLAPFIVMPFILKSLGTDLFGMWMLILSFTSMVVFIDFGIGNGLLTKLSYEIGLNNKENIKKYVTTAYFILSIIFLIMFFILIFSLFIFRNIFSIDEIGIIFVTFTAFFLTIPISVIQKIMYAKQEILKYNLWQIMATILAIMSCLLCIKSNLNPVIIIFGYSFSFIFVNLILTFIFFQKNKKFVPDRKYFSKKNAQELLSVGSKFLILSMITSIALNIDNIIIAQKIGKAMVTEYSVPAKLTTILGLIISVLFMPLWTANGQAIAKKDFNWVEKITIKMSILGFIVVSLFSIIFFIFNKEFISIWMGRTFLNQEYTILFLSLFSCAMSIVSPWFMVLNSLNIIKFQIVIWFIYLILSVFLKWVLLSEANFWILPLISFILYSIIILPSCIYFTKVSIMKLKGRVLKSDIVR